MTGTSTSRRTATALAAAGFAGLLALTACSSGSDSASTSSAPANSASASGSSSSASASPSSSSTETILAVLCDEATPESVAAIEAKLQPDFKVSQLVDVRTDDAGTHAILGFVEGPGLAVLAQWTGTGLNLDGLAAADEFAGQVTGLPVTPPSDQATTDLLGQTVTCYTTIYAPEDGDKKKKGDKKAE